MHKIIGAALALATTVCLTASTAAAAHAEKVVHRDARGDVIRQDYSFETETETETPVPTVKSSDITSTVVDHRRDNVFVTVRHAELDSHLDLLHGYLFSLVTNERLGRTVVLHVSPSTSRQGEVKLVTQAGRRVTCIGLRGRIDYRANTVRIRVPRSCLSNPRWVRAGIYTFHTGRDWSRAFVDDANLNGRIRNAGPVHGPRVRRG
ncbi:hypothetical protein ASD66_10390 [Nocardioides sp. Root151]|nr:hypothetical protein ASD66_10390 [Nocardioides sp. Root151]KRF16175.1 hypothetical protein ASH02_06155 [Nocardioides sp. Soil796]